MNKRHWINQCQHRFFLWKNKDKRYSILQKEIAEHQRVSHLETICFLEQVEDVVNQMKSYSEFYIEAQVLIQDPIFQYDCFSHLNFCGAWAKEIEKQLSRIEQEQHDQNRLQELIKLYQSADRSLASTNVKNTAHLWDLSHCSLTQRECRDWANMSVFLKKHKDIQEIVAQLGRSSRLAHIHNHDNELIIKDYDKLIESKETEGIGDVVGVHPSDELNRLLPCETLLLLYPELEGVFYQRLVEKQLMTYEMHNQIKKTKKLVSTREWIDPDLQEQGPYVIAIDASGSMMGLPEQCAKAFAYALMMLAYESDRSCYVLLFSTKCVQFELTKQHSLNELLDFLSYSFHGGTDFDVMLTMAFDILNQKNYQYADLVGSAPRLLI